MLKVGRILCLAFVSRCLVFINALRLTWGKATLAVKRLSTTRSLFKANDTEFGPSELRDVNCSPRSVSQVSVDCILSWGISAGTVNFSKGRC
jgi:hypothetical protein